MRFSPWKRWRARANAAAAAWWSSWSMPRRRPGPGLKPSRRHGRRSVHCRLLWRQTRRPAPLCVRLGQDHRGNPQLPRPPFQFPGHHQPVENAELARYRLQFRLQNDPFPFHAPTPCQRGSDKPCPTRGDVNNLRREWGRKSFKFQVSRFKIQVFSFQCSVFSVQCSVRRPVDKGWPFARTGPVSWSVAARRLCGYAPASAVGAASL